MSTPDTDPTQPPGRIVVGVDGSPHSRQALLWALHQARLTGQPVEAVISWSIPVDWGVGGVGNVLTIDWAGQAAATLAETIGSLGDEPGADRVVQHVVMGPPHASCSTPRRTRTCWSSAAGAAAASPACCSARSASTSSPVPRARSSWCTARSGRRPERTASAGSHERNRVAHDRSRRTAGDHPRHEETPP